MSKKVDVEKLHTTREIAEGNNWAPQTVRARAYTRGLRPHQRRGKMDFWTDEQRRILEAPLPKEPANG